MATKRGNAATAPPGIGVPQGRSVPGADSSGANGKQPRTERGARTLRALLNAAAAEFGEKGFHEGSISGITSRAGVALGSFYTYFDSKDEIFRALVSDMSNRVRDEVAPAIATAQGTLDGERLALEAFLRFAAEHKEIYRIIDESEFVDPASFRRHYESTVRRIEQRLAAGVASGEVRPGVGEAHAWAIMGMNVFLGLRYGVWGGDGDPAADGRGEDAAAVAATVNAMLARGIGTD